MTSIRFRRCARCRKPKEPSGLVEYRRQMLCAHCRLIAEGRLMRAARAGVDVVTDEMLLQVEPLRFKRRKVGDDGLLDDGGG